MTQREASAAAEAALKRLRETLQAEREAQVRSMLEEKERAVRTADQRFHAEVHRHQEHHRHIRAQLTASNDRIAALEAQLRLGQREKEAQLRSKDEAVLDALERARREHADAHASTVEHYEQTVAELQTSLAATRAKLADVEERHATAVRNVVADRNRVAGAIARDQEGHLTALSKGLELEVGRTNDARQQAHAACLALHETTVQLKELGNTHSQAIRRERARFQEQLHTVRVEISSQHAQELAVERRRAGDLEESLLTQEAKYHALSDELRRRREKHERDRAQLREETQRVERLTIEVGTLAALRDELRARVSALTVRLASTEEVVEGERGKVESKQKDVAELERELEALKARMAVAETGESKSPTPEQEKQHEPDEPPFLLGAAPSGGDGGGGAAAAAGSSRSAGSPPAVAVLGERPRSPREIESAIVLRGQLQGTLKECARLRKEVQTMRAQANEKDFRLGALREIVAGLEKMVEQRGGAFMARPQQQQPPPPPPQQPPPSLPQPPPSLPQQPRQQTQRRQQEGPWYPMRRAGY